MSTFAKSATTHLAATAICSNPAWFPAWAHGHAARQELSRRVRSRTDYIQFVKLFTPGYLDGWVHREVAKRLEAFIEAVELGLSPRLMIFMPPRVGKSVLVSRLFPPWILGRHPDWEVVCATYNQEIANLFGRYVRSIVNDPIYKDLYPGMQIDPGSNAQDHVETLSRGSYTAVGIGGGLTGRGARILVIDDPVKDREDADSETIREKTWDWYASTARTRLAPGGGIIVLQTRWHEDDLSGRLIEQAKKDPGADQWHVFEYPALAYEGELFREKGEALHPERFGVDSYDKLRRSIPARDWNALYQQRPAPEDGDYFRADWFKRYTDIPSSLNRYLAVDLAVGTTTANDYTVIAPFGVDCDSNIYFMKDALRARLTAMESVDNILRLAKQHNVVSIAIEKGHISKAIGPYLAKKMREDGKFYHIHEFTPSRDKMTRATSLRARMQNGKVFFPTERQFDEDWRPEFMAFPAARHDDTVDACAYAALMLEDLIAAPATGGKPATAPLHPEGSYDALAARGARTEPVSQFNLYGKAKKSKNAWTDEGKHYVR